MILTMLLIGALLRFWGIWEAGYHHDELSALLRTRFESFSTLIEQGVRIDGHPAFTQVFLWLWYQLVGAEAWLIKLPFVLSGILSIYFLFRTGAMMFSKPTGLIAAAGMATLQYGIIYAQWARPYAFGILAVVLVAFSLLRYIQNGERKDLLLFTVAAAWTGYTHYFALLEAILFVGVFWLFYMNKRQRLELAIAGLLALLLWLPHLNITLHHLRIGGIGDWLDAAPLAFGWQLIAFAGHYSWWMVIPLILGLYVLTLNPSSDRSYWLKMALLAVAFVFPFLIAFYYSHWQSALLHEGTMAFAFPFFLLFVSGLWFATNRATQKLVASYVLVMGAYTLINDRLHLQLNLQTEFNDPIAWFHQEQVTYQEQGTELSAFFDLRPDAVAWLDQHDQADFSQVTLFESLPEQHWVEALGETDADALMLTVTAASAPEYLAVAQSIFPYIKAIRHYHTASCYVLERAPTGNISQHLLGVDHPMQLMRDKEYLDPLIMRDTLSLPFTYLIGTAVFSGTTGDELKLVIDGEPNDERYWRSVDAKLYKKHSDQASFHVHQALDLRDVVDIGKAWELKLYPWNPSRSSGLLRTLSWRLIPSNPVRYGLFKPIPDKSLVEISDGKVKSLFNFEGQN